MVLKVTRLCPWKSWDRLLKNKGIEKWCNGSIYFFACCMQRRWMNTLKLRFLSQKLHQYTKA
ncbi:hypothetical protein JHK87_004457 [Glycine soja]|nr:hypothetical protein JHK87_004457 [Glycine soja]